MATTDRTKNPEAGVTKDEGDLIDAGGPPAYSSPDGQGRGQLEPDAGGFRDNPDPLTDAGGPAAHRAPDSLQVAQRAPGPPLQSTEEADRPGQAAGVSDVLQAAAERSALLGDDHPGRPVDAGGFFDATEALLGAVCEYNPHTPTTDSEAHTHLDNERVYLAFLYDTDPGRNPGEAWAQPTVDSFTGYARDGTHYTGGVQDAGPVQAPWSAEGASNNRSSRASFPTRVLVVVSAGEIVLYDLDNWPTTFDVWARCTLGAYFFFGRPSNKIRRVYMKNGVLYAIGEHDGTTNGALWCFDFKRDGDQNALHVIRADWNGYLIAGKDFTDRATTGWAVAYSSSFRLQNEYPYELAVHQDPSDPLRVWCAMSGEDGFDVIELYDNVPQKDYVDTPTGTANIGDARSVAIDPSGMLWLAQDDKIWRNAFDYQGGVIVNPNLPNNGDINGRLGRRYPVTTLPDGLAVRQLVATQNWILAATDRGVYAIHKTSLAVHLAYSVAGGGGLGVSEAATGGEAIPGNREIVAPTLAIWNAQKSAYLMIATYLRGGIAVVRLRDDIVVQSREHNILQEPGAFFTIGFVE